MNRRIEITTHEELGPWVPIDVNLLPPDFSDVEIISGETFAPRRTLVRIGVLPGNSQEPLIAMFDQINEVVSSSEHWSQLNRGGNPRGPGIHSRRHYSWRASSRTELV